MPAGASARVSLNVYWTTEIFGSHASHLLGTGIFLLDICSISGFIGLLLLFDQQLQPVWVTLLTEPSSAILSVGRRPWKVSGETESQSERWLGTALLNVLQTLLPVVHHKESDQWWQKCLRLCLKVPEAMYRVLTVRRSAQSMN